MRSKKSLFYLVTLALCALVVSRAAAQPSSAEIKSHLTGPKVVSSVIHGPGTRSWDSAYSKYVWEIGFTNKVKDANNPGLIIVVDGFLAYDIVGGRYVYWRSFTSRNSYQGIPDPTAADVQALIKQFGIGEFMGGNFRSVVGQVESIGLSKEPKFEWHTPNSVSMNVVAVYTKKGNGIDAPDEHVTELFRVRLYRDDMRSPWNGVHSMFQRGDPHKTISSLLDGRRKQALAEAVTVSEATNV
jgi:hypothetical protein